MKYIEDRYHRSERVNMELYFTPFPQEKIPFAQRQKKLQARHVQTAIQGEFASRRKYPLPKKK